MLDTAVTGPEGPRSRPRPLLRTTLGRVLRRTRRAQGRTLADVARAARVSMPYLSEVERGRKEASSEVLAAICDALRIELSDLLAVVGHDLAQLRRARAAGRARARRVAAPGELTAAPDLTTALDPDAGRDLGVGRDLGAITEPAVGGPGVGADLDAAGAAGAAAEPSARLLRLAPAGDRDVPAPYGRGSGGDVTCLLAA